MNVGRCNPAVGSFRKGARLNRTGLLHSVSLRCGSSLCSCVELPRLPHCILYGAIQRSLSMFIPADSRRSYYYCNHVQIVVGTGRSRTGLRVAPSLGIDAVFQRQLSRRQSESNELFCPGRVSPCTPPHPNLSNLEKAALGESNPSSSCGLTGTILQRNRTPPALVRCATVTLSAMSGLLIFISGGQKAQANRRKLRRRTLTPAPFFGCGRSTTPNKVTAGPNSCFQGPSP